MGETRVETLKRNIGAYNKQFNNEGFHSMNHSAQKHCAELEKELDDIDHLAMVELRIIDYEEYLSKNGYTSMTWSVQKGLEKLRKERDEIEKEKKAS